VSPTLTLTEFLLQHIAEGEDRAAAVLDMQGGGWRVVEHPVDGWVSKEGRQGVDYCIETDLGQPVAQDIASGSDADRRLAAEHLVAFQPAYVLAECEAKRRIVEHLTGPAYDDETVLRLLALPYADHESFQEEWRA